MSTLIIAEHDNQLLNSATAKTIQAAQALSNQATVLVIGFNCRKVAEQVAHYESVAKVLLADYAGYEHQLPENSAKLIAALAKDFKDIIAPATTFGKNLMPRVAALLDVVQVSDVIKIIDANTFVRPIYAGNAIATIKVYDPIKVLTIRTAAFATAKEQAKNAPIEAVSLQLTHDKTKFVNLELTKSERPDLTNARVVISGGRGLQSGDNFKLLESLADRLNAAIGASRAAVDAGFVPNDYQVGQTGKIIAPELYIAIGISGAIQHLAGMKDSKVIVAINKDPEAPIFQVADYGLVGDLFKIIPELNEELDKLKG